MVPTVFNKYLLLFFLGNILISRYSWVHLKVLAAHTAPITSYLNHISFENRVGFCESITEKQKNPHTKVYSEHINFSHHIKYKSMDYMITLN